MGTLLFLRVFGAVALLGVLLTLGAGVGASQLAPNAPPLTLLSGPLSPPIWPRWTAWAARRPGDRWTPTAPNRRLRWTACCTTTCAVRGRP
ncbi:hypothetical protein ACFP9V_15035 [Deinococcus radiopugnans]